MTPFRWREEETDTQPERPEPAPIWATGHPAAIEDNRAGRLAGEQRRSLARRCAWQGSLLACLAAAGGTLVVLAVSHRIVVALVLPAAMLVVVALARFPLPLLLDLVRNRVSEVAGLVGIQARDRGGPLLVVGDRSFPARDELLERISTGFDYRVYYLPVSRRIVNWEQLDIPAEQAGAEPTHPAARTCRVCGAAASSTSERRCRYCGAELPW